jgi:NDP-sugar pyrophosphorylase family protein
MAHRPELPFGVAELDAGSVLEREPFERLAAHGRVAYRHAGFWRCLDTAKDAIALEEAGPSRRLA